MIDSLARIESSTDVASESSPPSSQIPTPVLCHIFSYIKDRKTWEACHLTCKSVHQLMRFTCPAPFPEKALQVAGVNDMDIFHPNLSTGAPSVLAMAVSFGTVSVWGSQNGKITSFSTPGADIVNYSPDGRYLAVVCQQEGLVSIFDATDNMYPLLFQIRRQFPVTTITFSPCSEKLAVGQCDGSILMYSFVSTSYEDKGVHFRSEATIPVLSSSASPSHLIFHQTRPQIWCCLSTPKIFTNRHIIALWDLRHKRIVQSCFFEDGGDEMEAIAMSGSSEGVHFVASISDSRSTLIWNLDRKEGLYQPEKSNEITCPTIDHMTHDEKNCHSMKISSLDLSLDGRRLVTGSYDNSIRVWDIPSGRCIRKLKGHDRFCKVVKFMTPNGSSVVSTGLDQTVRFWNI